MTGRTPDGQFSLGNPGGPGRPPRRTEKTYLDALVGRVTMEDWAAIVDKAVTDAKAGDRHARAWLSAYLMGETSEAEGLLRRIEELEKKYCLHN